MQNISHTIKAIELNAFIPGNLYRVISDMKYYDYGIIVNNKPLFYIRFTKDSHEFLYNGKLIRLQPYWSTKRFITEF